MSGSAVAGFVLLFGGQIVPFEMTQTVINKIQRHVLAYVREAAQLNGVYVIPAFPVEAVIDNCVAQDESHLALGHSGFQFVDH